MRAMRAAKVGNSQELTAIATERKGFDSAALRALCTADLPARLPIDQPSLQHAVLRHAGARIRCRELMNIPKHQFTLLGSRLATEASRSIPFAVREVSKNTSVLIIGSDLNSLGHWAADASLRARGYGS